MKAKHDPVTAFFDEYSGAVPDLARRLRDVIRSALPDAHEELDRPGGVVGYGYDTGYSGLVCTIILSKAGVKLGIVGGAQMADPANLLEGAGKQHRYIAFTRSSDFDKLGIGDLLQAAATRWKERQREGQPCAATPKPNPIMKTNLLTRRQFTRTLVATAIATGVAPAFLRGQNLNSKLNIAVIGVGGRGGGNLESVSSENIVAVCDVNGKNLDKAAAKFPQARKLADFRKVFDHAKEFDAVVVSTCEHTHAFATMPALQLGKHVYCEKPLTYNIWEARKIREAAAKAKVTTQMGIQIHATENYRQVVELVQSGIIGPVREAHVWVGRAWGWQSQADAKRHNDIVWVVERPTETQPVPEGLNWDLWLGPAPARPFNSVYFPGPKWYRWWDFGNGTMSDLGSHWNDLPFWALKLQAPLTIEASGPPPHPEIAPASMSATYEYGARGDMPPVKLTWHQGENKPEIWKTGGIPQWDSGCLFIGSKGMILADYGKHTLLPEKDFAGFQRPAPTIPRVTGHHEEWLAACRSGKICSANFEYSGWLTEANHLGNVAYRVGKKLLWDPKKLKATNAPEADRFVHRTYRKGWKL